MNIDHTLPEHSGATGIAAVAAVAFTLIALGWFALRPITAPAPAPAPTPATADAAASAFSARRALVHADFLAQAPRPIASAANAEARRYLLDQLAAIGLPAQVQTATVQTNSVDFDGNVRVTLAVVNNVLVRIPGRAASAPALLLASHYDSGERKLGTSGAGASVAAMLETLRALRAGAPLDNDLICLFADGEEAGELGTLGFVEQHPWARQVGVVLKFDAGASAGRQMLFDSRGASGAAIDAWADATPGPLGSSFMSAVLPLTAPAKTMGMLARIGHAGLHFATVADGSGATGARGQGTPARLDSAGMQQLGETMLGLVRHGGGPGPGPDAAANGEQVYFNLPGWGVVHYAQSLVWPLTRLACLLFAGLCCVAIRRRELEPIDIVYGAVGFLFIGGALVFAVFVLWKWLPAVRPGYQPDVFGAAFQGRWHLLACATLATALFIHLQRLLQRKIGTCAATLGALACLLLSLLLASALLPGASFVLSWPLLAALLTFGVLHAMRAAPLAQRYRVPILLAGAAPGVFLLAPLFRDACTLITPERIYLPVAVLALLLGVALPLLNTVRRRCVVRPLALACVASLAVASAAAPPSAAGAPPPATELVYYKDSPTWQAYWLHPAGALDRQTRDFFPDANAPREPVELFGYGSAPLWVAPAPSNAVQFPYIEVLKDSDGDGQRVRHVEFMLRSDNAAPALELWIEGEKTVRTALNGRVLTDELNRSWKLKLFGLGPQRLHFSLDLQPGKTFRVHIEERIPGLPPGAPDENAAPRQSGIGAGAGMTIAADTLLFR
jgi:hypothetical protein